MSAQKKGLGRGLSALFGDIENQKNIDTVRREVIELCNRFPVYKEA